jgi:Zn-dependent protease
MEEGTPIELLAPQTATSIEAPAPVTNCPDCTLWLPPGTLACPECHAILYANYLQRLAQAATAQEQASDWAAARLLWQQALTWLPAGTTQAQAIEQHLVQLDAQAKAVTDQRAKWTKRLGPLAPIAFFLIKIKSLLFSAKFLFSFLAFFGFYWAIFGWKFGLGFTLAILIHESGHYIAARRRGLKVDLPIFLPGFGAYVRWYHQGVSLETLSEIALAGPLYGLFVAIACLGIALKAHSPLFLALAYTTAFLNTLNLIPVLGLDGAQATFTLNRLQRVLIALASIFLYVMLREWVYLGIAAGMGWRSFTGLAPEQPSSRGMIAYMLLLIALGAIMWAAPDGSRGTYGMFR